jgi:hypothetical protein
MIDDLDIRLQSMRFELSLSLNQKAILCQRMVLELASQVKLNLISKQYHIAILIRLNGFGLERLHLNIPVSRSIDLQTVQRIVLNFYPIFKGLQVNPIQLCDELEYLWGEVDCDSGD